MVDFGLDIAIPFTGDPDPSLPWADDDDALLVPGSLALFEPAHSSNPVTGVPALNADVPNIAWKRLRDLIGSAVVTGRVDSGTAGTAGNVLTVTAVASGSIATGQIITGAGISGTVYITRQISGTPGGIGTYQTNASSSSNTGSQTFTAAAIDATSGAFTRAGVADVAGGLITERSVKGGLHGIVSQTNDTVDARYAAIIGKTALASYIAANRSHSFYMSQWHRVTRAALSESNGASFKYGYGSGGTNYLILKWAGDAYSLGLNSPLGNFNDPASPNTLGNGFRASAATGPGTGTSAAQLTMAGWGLLGSYSSAATYGGKSQSDIIYRSYWEDLTVSGRTYAQVQALDYALWQAAFAPGGRYAGDTFTAPAI